VITGWSRVVGVPRGGITLEVAQVVDHFVVYCGARHTTRLSLLRHARGPPERLPARRALIPRTGPYARWRRGCRGRRQVDDGAGSDAGGPNTWVSGRVASDDQAGLPRPAWGYGTIHNRPCSPGTGSIINIASPAATVSLDRYGLAGYGASKAAVVALIRELAAQ
jgi:NAD(P)-dependent dehydrogenase (short-subunit alcohol dehydrogenase family)